MQRPVATPIIATHLTATTCPITTVQMAHEIAVFPACPLPLVDVRRNTAVVEEVYSLVAVSTV